MNAGSPEDSGIKPASAVRRPEARASTMVRCSSSGMPGYSGAGGLRMCEPPKAPAMVSRRSAPLPAKDSDSLRWTPVRARRRFTVSMASRSTSPKPTASLGCEQRFGKPPSDFRRSA
jgi:hypothetical protein